MDDMTKKALEWIREMLGADRRPVARALLAHIDGEPARQQAACDRRAEEVREACARSCQTCKGAGFVMRVRECPFCDDSTFDHECPTDKVKVLCLCGAERVRATPLTATPLGDENTSLRASLERADEGVRYWTELAQAEAREAAALRARVAELEKTQAMLLA